MPAKRPTKAATQTVGEAPAGIAEDDDAATEWRRIVEACEQAGKPLTGRDRTALTLYCRTWTINRALYAHVKQFGPIVIWPNTLPGPSPQFKAWKETAYVLRGLLRDLGLTPASRKFAADGPDDASAEDLEF